MKKKYAPLKTLELLMFFLLVFCICACKEEDSDKDGVIDETDQCISVKGSKPTGCPIVPKIGKVTVYLETSVSMGGYFEGHTVFKDIIADLAIKIDKEISPVSIKFISDSVSNYNGDASNFSSGIHNLKAEGKSSELHKIFKDIASNSKGTDVSILVSDCILSFSNAEVKKNPSISVQQASTTLKNNIYNTFSDLRKNNQAASVYAYSSMFFGKYYDYQNVVTNLKGTMRPFYVWVIAKNNILPLFEHKFNDIRGFKPEQSLYFGLIANPITNYRILPQLGMKGEWKPLMNKVGDVGIEVDDDDRDNNSQVVNAGLNLSTLPFYARTIDYLKENLIVNQKGCVADVKITEKGAKGKIKSKKQLAYFQEATHIINITIKDITLDQASITITLPLKYDTWYRDSWSTMDDKKIQTLGKKTFAFQYLVEGVAAAYNNNGKNFINLNFQINK